MSDVKNCKIWMLILSLNMMHIQNLAGNTTATNIPIKEKDSVIFKINYCKLSFSHCLLSEPSANVKPTCL